MSFKPEVQVNDRPEWAGNALRFATRKEAEENVFDLMMRWFSVSNTRVVEVDEPATHTYTDGKLGCIAQAGTEGGGHD
jgi:hypothetical protein